MPIENFKRQIDKCELETILNDWQLATVHTKKVYFLYEELSTLSRWIHIEA